jgi:hypothetical protein
MPTSIFDADFAADANAYGKAWLWTISNQIRAW